MTSKILAAAACLSALAGPALALSEAERAEFRRNCTADYSRLCSQFNPDSPEVQQCFRQKIQQVSPRCQATIQKMSGAGR